MSKCFVPVSGVMVAILLGGMAYAQDLPPSLSPKMMPRPGDQLPGPLMSDLPGAQMPGADPFHLLLNSIEIQKDLGLTKDQLARLNRASRNFRNKLQELSYQKPGGSRDGVRADIEGHLQDTRGMIARELTPTQLGRLQQIMLQLEGPCLAIIDKAVGEQLKLSPDQLQLLAGACEKRSVQMREAFHYPGGSNFCASMAENRVRVEKVRSHADQEILALLGSSQREMFSRMSGKRIQLTPPTPPECS